MGVFHYASLQWVWAFTVRLADVSFACLEAISRVWMEIDG